MDKAGKWHGMTRDSLLQRLSLNCTGKWTAGAVGKHSVPAGTWSDVLIVLCFNACLTCRFGQQHHPRGSFRKWKVALSAKAIESQGGRCEFRATLFKTFDPRRCPVKDKPRSAELLVSCDFACFLVSAAIARQGFFGFYLVYPPLSRLSSRW